MSIGLERMGRGREIEGMLVGVCGVVDGFLCCCEGLTRSWVSPKRDRRRCHYKLWRRELKVLLISHCVAFPRLAYLVTFCLFQCSIVSLSNLIM